VAVSFNHDSQERLQAARVFNVVVDVDVDVTVVAE
jgi:hypothetical protein